MSPQKIRRLVRAAEQHFGGRCRAGRGRPPNDVRRPLDDVDRASAWPCWPRTPGCRTTRSPSAVGIAPSTCLAGCARCASAASIRGYHADVDPAALGRPLQAMIAVRLQSHARGHIPDFMAKIAALPEVLNVFFLGGADDFLVHIAAHEHRDLRDFVVVNLSGDPDVALTETNLIFEHVRGAPLQ